MLFRFFAIFKTRKIELMQYHSTFKKLKHAQLIRLDHLSNNTLEFQSQICKFITFDFTSSFQRTVENAVIDSTSGEVALHV